MLLATTLRVRPMVGLEKSDTRQSATYQLTEPRAAISPSDDIAFCVDLYIFGASSVQIEGAIWRTATVIVCSYRSTST